MIYITEAIGAFLSAWGFLTAGIYFYTGTSQPLNNGLTLIVLGATLFVCGRIIYWKFREG